MTNDDPLYHIGCAMNQMLPHNVINNINQLITQGVGCGSYGGEYMTHFY